MTFEIPYIVHPGSTAQGHSKTGSYSQVDLVLFDVVLFSIQVYGLFNLSIAVET